MCNLYSIRRPRDEVIGLFGISSVDDGVQLELPAVYPDTMGPIIRLDDNGARNLTMMRWGFPPPPKGGPRPVTNLRNTKSPYWRNWLQPEFRCLVPATSFCEWTDSRPKVPHWFALDDTRPAFAFAGKFLALAEGEGISDIEELNKILDRAVNLKNFLKGKERVKKVAKYVADHYRENVEPLGYKAFSMFTISWLRTLRKSIDSTAHAATVRINPLGVFLTDAFE